MAIFLRAVRLKVLIVVLVGIVFFTFVASGVAMTSLIRGEKTEIVVFSPMEGRLLFEGRPVSDAELELWVKWKDKKGETYHFRTDESGLFSIPRITDTYRDSPLAQLVITQEITVEYRGESYLIWTLSKGSGKLNVEFGGEPKNLVCELTEDLRPIRTDDALLGARCTWEV